MLILLLLALLQTPDPTLPPPTAKPTHTAEGRGVQIYRCTQETAAYTWIFQSPEAVLLDLATHKQLGTHGTGPSWTWNDGSAITGKVLQKSSSPDPSSVPWLLLATSPSGNQTGALSSIAFVRRSDTRGGNAPSAGCDAQHVGATLRVPYTATYTFYAQSLN